MIRPRAFSDGNVWTEHGLNPAMRYFERSPWASQHMKWAKGSVMGIYRRWGHGQGAMDFGRLGQWGATAGVPQQGGLKVALMALHKSDQESIL
jgi:hypothetical protein